MQLTNSLLALMMQQLLLLQVLTLLVSAASIRSDDEFNKNEVCYGDLGCFRKDGHFWDIVHRPITRLPESPEKINTKFLLYTRKNRSKPQQLVYEDRAGVASSNFDASRETKVILHGFLADVDSSAWMESMKNSLLDLEDFNVILLDWRGGNQLPYTLATANTQVVGAVAARFVRWLEMEFQADRTRFHFIGHSLGAHISGYAGARLSGRLGRITGMDPAGPYFEFMHPVVRLDETDALFVDAIHTDGSQIINIITLKGGLGLMQPVGHVDFYPNGGEQQTPCGRNNKAVAENHSSPFGASPVCNHSFGWEIMLYSIIHAKTRQYNAVPCDSYENYKAGKCSCGRIGCASLGINANKWNRRGQKNVKMYLDTTAKPPYEIRQ